MVMGFGRMADRAARIYANRVEPVLDRAGPAVERAKEVAATHLPGKLAAAGIGAGAAGAGLAGTYALLSDEDKEKAMTLKQLVESGDNEALYELWLQEVNLEDEEPGAFEDWLAEARAMVGVG